MHSLIKILSPESKEVLASQVVRTEDSPKEPIVGNVLNAYLDSLKLAGTHALFPFPERSLDDRTLFWRVEVTGPEIPETLLFVVSLTPSEQKGAEIPSETQYLDNFVAPQLTLLDEIAELKSRLAAERTKTQELESENRAFKSEKSFKETGV